MEQEPSTKFYGVFDNISETYASFEFLNSLAVSDVIPTNEHT